MHKDFLGFYYLSFIWSYDGNYLTLRKFFSVFWSHHQNFLSWECSTPAIIFTDLCWTRFTMSTSFVYWGARNWTQYSRRLSPVLSKRQGCPPLACWQWSSCSFLSLPNMTAQAPLVAACGNCKLKWM